MNNSIYSVIILNVVLSTLWYQLNLKKIDGNLKYWKFRRIQFLLWIPSAIAAAIFETTSNDLNFICTAKAYIASLVVLLIITSVLIDFYKNDY